MRIDFHTHTTASDGALDPAVLVERAAAEGITMLAITDHDTVAGFLAVATLPVPGLNLVPGVELSCQWGGATIHILGLGIDCDHPVMLEGLEHMAQARQERTAIIARRLASKGFEGALEGALAMAGSSQPGRPHFARWMVEKGHVADFSEAFDRYLGRGKVGDVKACWPELPQVVDWITQSGGVAVVAHPLKYRFTLMKLRRLLAAFKAAGGQGIEVASGRQTADQAAQLQSLAVHYDLEVSVGSDFHQDATYGAPLGLESAPFEHLAVVWERWKTRDVVCR